MSDAINAFLLVYAGLFPIVNPVAGAPIFLGLTRRCVSERHVLARSVARDSFLLLLASLFVGSHVLEFFGITLPIVRIAGGLEAYAFYPLTMPFTVGPGSISVAIALGSQRPKEATDLVDLALLGGAAIAALAAIAVTVYLCYRFAERIVAALGESGTNVLVRLSAFILLCIGVQIIWNGWRALAAGAA